MYLDVDILMALVKEKDFHKGYAEYICSLPKEKYTSVISLVELEIVIKREINNEMSLIILQLLHKIIPTLKIVPCTEKIFERSLEIRRKDGLGIFDAIHAATALEHDKEIASTDHIYKKVKGLTIV